MIYKLLDQSKQKEVEALFASAFTSSEGETEGRLIGALSSQLASGIDHHEIICFGVYDSQVLIGSIFFTRLQCSPPIEVYMLAPVAVSAEHQGQGVGQALIRYGLHALKKRAANVVVTYGDPSFYSKVGFQALSETVIPAPLTLSMPFGWQGQSLTGAPIPTIAERPACVTAFNNPVYW